MVKMDEWMDSEPVLKKQKTTVGQSVPSPATIKKSNEVFEFMRSKRLSISDFISSIPYVEGNGRRQEVIVQSLFQNEDVLMDLLFKRNYDVDFNPLCNVLSQKLIAEIRQLQSKNDLFGKFKLRDDKEAISNAVYALGFGKDEVGDIYKQAPILTKLFNDLLLNNQQNDKEMNSNNESQTSNSDNKLILILSVLCYTRNKKKSTNLPTLFGLYLNSLGLTTKRGLQIFNKFGISVNQKSINDVLGELSRLTKEKKAGDNDNYENEKTGGQPNNHSSRSLNDSLVLPFTQKIISSTNNGYKSTSEVLKLSDAKFSQLFDQYTNTSTAAATNTSHTTATDTTDTNIDPKISNEMQQTKPH